MQNRLNITPKLKDKDLIQMMKKGAYLASVGSIQQEMGKFYTCHHFSQTTSFMVYLLQILSY